MSARLRPHPYDEDYEPAVQLWLEFVSPAETRAPTKPIDPYALSALTELCREAPNNTEEEQER